MQIVKIHSDAYGKLELLAEVNGPFALHESADGFSSGAVITHVPSGFAMLKTANRTEALLAFADLAGSINPLEWDSADAKDITTRHGEFGRAFQSKWNHRRGL